MPVSTQEYDCRVQIIHVVLTNHFDTVPAQSPGTPSA